MPITITVPTAFGPGAPANQIIGPGTVVTVTSDFIGPLLNGSQFVLTISQDDSYNHVVTSQWVFTNEPTAGFTVWVPGQGGTAPGPWQPTEGATVFVSAFLEDPTSTVLDFGQINVTWSSTAAIQEQILELTSPIPPILQNTQTLITNVGTLLDHWTHLLADLWPALTATLGNILGGITATITTAAGAVQMTLSQLFTQSTLDRLTLVEVSPGETCVPVEFGFGGTVYGIIVRCTTIPAYYARGAPGDSLYIQDLAVLQIFRGADGLARFGIRSNSQMIYPIPGVWWSQTIALFNLTPPGMSLRVDWANGVCGRVFIMQLP